MILEILFWLAVVYVAALTVYCLARFVAELAAAIRDGLHGR